MSDVRISIPVFKATMRGGDRLPDTSGDYDMRSMSQEQLDEVDALGGIHCADDIRELGWMFPPDFRGGRF